MNPGCRPWRDRIWNRAHGGTSDAHADAHAASCPSCGAFARRAADLFGLLRAQPADPGPAFAEEVLARARRGAPGPGAREPARRGPARIGGGRARDAARFALLLAASVGAGVAAGAWSLRGREPMELSGEGYAAVPPHAARGPETGGPANLSRPENPWARGPDIRRIPPWTPPDDVGPDAPAHPTREDPFHGAPDSPLPPSQTPPPHGQEVWTPGVSSPSGREGESPQSSPPQDPEAARDAVAWLLSRQRPDGGWGDARPGDRSKLRATAWVLRSLEMPDCTRGSGAGDARIREAADRARGFLLSQVGPDGRFRDAEDGSLPPHAAAIEALVARPMADDDPARDALERAVRYAASTRSRGGGGGWGRTPEDPRPESWSTTWMLRALGPARAGGLPVPRALLEEGSGWLRRATDDRTGRTGMHNRGEAPPDVAGTPAAAITAATATGHLATGMYARDTRLSPVWRRLATDATAWADDAPAAPMDLDYLEMLACASAHGIPDAGGRRAARRALQEAAGILRALQAAQGPDAGAFPAIPSPWRPDAGPEETTAAALRILAQAGRTDPGE